MFMRSLTFQFGSPLADAAGMTGDPAWSRQHECSLELTEHSAYVTDE
jgi:hypothetical protein